MIADLKEFIRMMAALFASFIDAMNQCQFFIGTIHVPMGNFFVAFSLFTIMVIVLWRGVKK